MMSLTSLKTHWDWCVKASPALARVGENQLAVSDHEPERAQFLLVPNTANPHITTR